MILFVIYLCIGTLFSSIGAHVDHAGHCDPVKFATEFYVAAHEENPSENVLVSPLSIQIGLGLLFVGANGVTSDQIIQSLHIYVDTPHVLASHFEEILGRYTTSSALKLATKIYTKKGMDLNQQFRDVARTVFHSDVEGIAFGESGRAADQINSWVENHTGNKIKDLVSADQFDATTRMVLINAVHFKAAWWEPFDVSFTKKMDFWINETVSQQVDMMFNYASIKYGYLEDLDAKVGFLPYNGTDLEMMILLPNSRTGLAELEGKLKTLDLFDIRSRLDEVWVDIALPRFEFGTTVDLKKVLSKMGMAGMFSESTSFPKILANGESLKLDEAVHKAYIKVDEEGTEAAAASVDSLVPTSIGPAFYAYHPFLFAIVGPREVVFIGSVRKLL